ncbi:MAG: hypothetical protein BWK80_52140 [Desulfobacteraceae bacterium IS3]|nr:MAG: hypothetical protein BWK80_52140 [Desulfobacteraceae bacterium IS3]
MPIKKEIKIKAMWDTEAEVRIAVSDDVPGLVTEAETSEQLVGKLRILIPELLEANGLLKDAEQEDIPFHLSSDRTEIIRRTVLFSG